MYKRDGELNNRNYVDENSSYAFFDGTNIINDIRIINEGLLSVWVNTQSSGTIFENSFSFNTIYEGFNLQINQRNKIVWIEGQGSSFQKLISSESIIFNVWNKISISKTKNQTLMYLNDKLVAQKIIFGGKGIEYKNKKNIFIIGKSQEFKKFAAEEDFSNNEYFKGFIDDIFIQKSTFQQKEVRKLDEELSEKCSQYTSEQKDQCIKDDGCDLYNSKCFDKKCTNISQNWNSVIFEWIDTSNVQNNKMLTHFNFQIGNNEALYDKCFEWKIVSQKNNIDMTQINGNQASITQKSVLVYFQAQDIPTYCDNVDEQNSVYICIYTFSILFNGIPQIIYEISQQIKLKVSDAILIEYAEGPQINQKVKLDEQELVLAELQLYDQHYKEVQDPQRYQNNNNIYLQQTIQDLTQRVKYYLQLQKIEMQCNNNSIQEINPTKVITSLVDRSSCQIQLSIDNQTQGNCQFKMISKVMVKEEYASSNYEQQLNNENLAQSILQLNIQKQNPTQKKESSNNSWIWISLITISTTAFFITISFMLWKMYGKKLRQQSSEIKEQPAKTSESPPQNINLQVQSYFTNMRSSFSMDKSTTKSEQPMIVFS